MPLTFLGEIDIGIFERASGRAARRIAVHQEVGWLVANGVNALAAYDASDPDTAVRDDHAQRWSLGLQLVPVPGITLDARGRLLLPAGELVGADFFLQLHVWN